MTYYVRTKLEDHIKAASNMASFMGLCVVASGSFAIISGIASKILLAYPTASSWAFSCSTLSFFSCAASAAFLTHFYIVNKNNTYEETHLNTFSFERGIAVLTLTSYIVAALACGYFKSPHLHDFQPLLGIGLTAAVITTYHHWQLQQVKGI